MKATVTLEIQVPNKISGKTVTQREISQIIKEAIESSVKDAKNLKSDFGNREILISSSIEVVSAQTNTLIQ